MSSLDRGYYGPDNGLALYYADVGYYDGIVCLGRINPTDMSFLQSQPDGFQVTIDRC